MLDRRSELRFQLKLEAMIEETRGQGAVVLRTRDVSSRGVYLHGEEQEPDGRAYRQGDLLLVQIYLPAFRPRDGRVMSVVRAEGCVVRLEEQGLAVRFCRESRIAPVSA